MELGTLVFRPQPVCNHGIVPISYTETVRYHHGQTLNANYLPMMTKGQNTVDKVTKCFLKPLTQVLNRCKAAIAISEREHREECIRCLSGCPMTGYRGRRECSYLLALDCGKDCRKEGIIRDYIQVGAETLEYPVLCKLCQSA